MAGRPTKFKKQYINRIIDFFSIEPFKKELMEETEEFYKEGGLKKKSQKYKHVANRLPTLFGFAKEIGVNYTTVWRWAEKGEDVELSRLLLDESQSLTKEQEEERENIVSFCNAYKEAKELQKEFLMSLGLNGVAPSAAYIFTAKNITDMRDRIETDITSNGQQIVGFNYVTPEPTNSANNPANTEAAPSV